MRLSKGMGGGPSPDTIRYTPLETMLPPCAAHLHAADATTHHTPVGAHHLEPARRKRSIFLNGNYTVHQHRTLVGEHGLGTAMQQL